MWSWMPPWAIILRVCRAICSARAPSGVVWCRAQYVNRKFKFTETQGENGTLWGGLCPHGAVCPTAGLSSRDHTDLGWGTWGIWKSHHSPHHRIWRAAGSRCPSPLWVVGATPGPAHGSQMCVAMLPESSGCSPTGHLCSPSTKMQREKDGSSSCLAPVQTTPPVLDHPPQISSNSPLTQPKLWFVLWATLLHN